MTNMQTRPDIWTAAGTTDWTMNGEIGMRILMLELADQYDKIFDPATGESGVDVVEVPGTAIKADALKSDSTVENLQYCRRDLRKSGLSVCCRLDAKGFDSQISGQ